MNREGKQNLQEGNMRVQKCRIRRGKNSGNCESEKVVKRERGKGRKGEAKMGNVRGQKKRQEM